MENFAFWNYFPYQLFLFLQVMEINKEMKNAFGSNLQGSNIRETKMTVMITVVVILFFICNITETTVFMLGSGDKIAHTPLIFHFVLCINSSVNSLVYGIFNSQYRKIFLEILCCKRKNDNFHSRLELGEILNTIQ